MDTVLVAEDDPIFSKIVSHALDQYNDKFKTICVGDGREAIQILDQEEVSLLVTDIQMPIINGFDLLNYKNNHLPELPCIVMTVHEAVEWRISDDIIKFFTKPLEMQLLVDAILEGLGKKDLNGSINGISVYNFLQLIEMEAKTCRFEVSSSNVEKGTFYFNEGVLYDAFCGNLSGEKAALKIINMDDVTIRFVDNPKKEISQNIKKGLMSLIMDAMAKKDENRKDKS